jgi:hypothetical protein
MNSKIVFRPFGLQQQPPRRVNQQQQQSSGSGEFQPTPSAWLDQAAAGIASPVAASHDGAVPERWTAT